MTACLRKPVTSVTQSVTDVMEVCQLTATNVATTTRQLRSNQTHTNALATVPITTVTTTLETESVSHATRNASFAMDPPSTTVRCV